MSDSFVFEVCVETPDGALAAAAGGADRLEMCSGLALGGLTPSLAALEHAVAHSGLPVIALLRPRRGDFEWSAAEVGVMERDLELAREAGAHGVAVGALRANGTLDLTVLERLATRSQGLELVHHRAFDHVVDPAAALEELASLGFARILTSGQAPSAPQGADLLHDLVARAAGRLTVMPGGGVRAANLVALHQRTGAREFHFSAGLRVTAPASPLAGRVPMDAVTLPGVGERIETCAETVRACVSALRPERGTTPGVRGRAGS